MKKQQFLNDVLINLKNEVSGFSILDKRGALLLSTPKRMVECEVTRGVVTLKVAFDGNLAVKTVDYNTGFKDNAVVLTTESIINFLGLEVK